MNTTSPAFGPSLLVIMPLALAACGSDPSSPTGSQAGDGGAAPVTGAGGGGAAEPGDDPSAGGAPDSGGPTGPVDPPEPPAATELTLLTYNVQARPVLDDARAQRNLPVIGQLLNDYDIAGVQECFSHADLMLAAATHPTKFYFDEREHWWSLANSGLASVARYPLIEVQTMHYSREAELGDTVASKGALLLSLDVGGHVVDVYNTHMQAGESEGAQDARETQADELVAFVLAHSPADHTVIVHGDFNMGPAREGRAWQDYSPNHYASEADMLARTAVFSGMMESLGVADASDTLFGPTKDYIDRVLFRAGAGVQLEPVAWRDDGARFVDGDGEPLSDSAPVAVRFRLVDDAK